MSEEYTVGQYLVDRLHQLGLEHLFSIAGDYSIDWVNNYVEPSKIQVVEEVNELNARLRGRRLRPTQGNRCTLRHLLRGGVVRRECRLRVLTWRRCRSC